MNRFVLYKTPTKLESEYFGKKDFELVLEVGDGQNKREIRSSDLDSLAIEAVNSEFPFLLTGELTTIPAPICGARGEIDKIPVSYDDLNRFRFNYSKETMTHLVERSE